MMVRHGGSQKTAIDLLCRAASAREGYWCKFEAIGLGTSKYSIFPVGLLKKFAGDAALTTAIAPGEIHLGQQLGDRIVYPREHAGGSRPQQASYHAPFSICLVFGYQWLALMYCMRSTWVLRKIWQEMYSMNTFVALQKGATSRTRSHLSGESCMRITKRCAHPAGSMA